MREALSSPEWLITEDGFDPERANGWETLCTVGNGYLGTRGTLEGASGRPLRHLPRGPVRRPRLPRGRPGQRAGLAVVRGVRRRHAPGRAQRRGARPRAHPRPAHRPALPAHRVRARRRPPHPAGDAALRVGGRSAHVRAAHGDHAGEPRGRDHRRERRRRQAAQPGTAAGLPPRAPRSRWRRAGRNGRSPATSTARNGRSTGTSPYLAMRTIASGITLGYAGNHPAVWRSRSSSGFHGWRTSA